MTGEQSPHLSGDKVAPPRLKAIRALQFYALLLACAWIVSAVCVSFYWVEEDFVADLHTESRLLEKEVNYVLSSVEQSLHQAEQLSTTLSFDRTILALAKNAAKQTIDLDALDLADRQSYVLNLPGAATVNTLFAQLAQHVETNQIFAQDKHGYCIGTSNSELKNSCLGYNYFNRDYFQKAKQTGSGRQFAIGKVVPTPSFFFSTAIADQGVFLGAVVVRQTVDQIIKIRSHQQLMVAMTEKNGIVLSSNRQELVFQQMPIDAQSLPSKGDIQKVFQRDTLPVIPVQMMPSPREDIKILTVANETYLMARGTVAAGDFSIYIFSPIERFNVSKQKNWGLAGTIILLGLLIVLLVERNINFTQHHLAHLKALSEANKNLALASQELYFLSVTDVLTGIANRRFFTQRLDEEIERQQRTADEHTTGGLALLAIDIDHFKRINDTYGHPAGDSAIRALAIICKNILRPYDVLGRMGGEEFAVLLNETNAQQAREIAERIRSNCATTSIVQEKSVFNQTCSIGIAIFKPNISAEQLLSQADRALYTAKNAGRNCVKAFDEI